MADERFEGPSDLHVHSIRSDGTETPADVMSSVHAHGVRTVALTDHDTTDGWTEGAAAATALGMTFIPGMEMSAKHSWRSVHILAYLFDPDDPDLRAETDRVRDDRIGRAERIVGNISRDYDLTWDDVLAATDAGATVGRPHIADALIQRGIVRDREQAFESILHPGGGYYVGHYAPDPQRAVELIVAAGGVPVLAHPAARDRVLPDSVLLELIDAGLAGFELGHRENTVTGRRHLARLAERHDLIVTGSSDYHGAGKPNVPGEHTTPDEMVARIIERGSGNRPVRP